MVMLQIIKTLLEAAAIGFIIWGIFNEHKLITFENRLGEVFRKK